MSNEIEKQRLYIELKDTIGKFSDLETEDINDVVFDVMSDVTENGIRRADDRHKAIAESLNRLSSLMYWIKVYSVMSLKLDNGEIDNAVKMSLFCYNLGPAPKFESIVVKRRNDVHKQVEHRSLDDDVPFLPGGEK